MDGNACQAQDMSDLGLAQSRSIVFDGDVVIGFVDGKAAQAVGVCEFAEFAELLVAERGLRLIDDFKKCHGGIIAVGKDGIL